MSGIVLDGKKIRDEILGELRPRVEALKAGGTTPALAVVLVGDDPASHIYVRNKLKASEELGIRSIEIRASGDLSTDQLSAYLRTRAAELEQAHAVLVQMPLPAQVNAEAITTRFVDGTRDVDGFGAFSLGQLVLNRPWPRACTPAGIMELLKRYEIPVAGRKAVVVGRSDIVGKPMMLLLLHQNATVTICHSKTQDLAAECQTADILIAAIGRPAMLDARHIKPGAVVIDVGMNRVTNAAHAQRLFQHEPKRLESFHKTGSVLVGDVDPQAMAELSSAYTPVPGGVGPLTIAMLMANTVTLAEHAAAS